MADVDDTSFDNGSHARDGCIEMSEIQPVAAFVIKRSIWLRGEGSDASYLLRSDDGKQCCLGIYLEACGMPRAELTDCAGPAEVDHYRRQIPAWMVHRELDYPTHTKTVIAAIEANDDAEMPETERETRLTALFAKAGIAVIFED